MYCPYCGLQSPDDVSFCGHCGAPLRVIPQSKGYIPITAHHPDQHPEQYQGSTRPQEDHNQYRPPTNPTGRGPIPKGLTRTRGLLTIAAVLIIFFVVILAVALIGSYLLGPSNNGNSNDIPGIANGQYLRYSATITTSAHDFTGTMRIDISNVTANNFTMTYTYTINGVNQVTKQLENYSGNDWSTASFSDANSSDNTSMTLVGQEQISTVYGNEMTDHYTANYSGYTYDTWSGTTNGCPYKLKFSYSDGMIVTCVLQDTNIKDFKA